jgi:hypothetical protein
MKQLPRLRKSGRRLLLLTVALGLALSSLGALACARECGTLVERRCRELGPESEACAALKARVAAVPHQSCEAVLNALDQKNRAR